MKKIVCFGLCFLIILCSFVASFAISSTDSLSYSLLYKRQGDSFSSSTWVEYPSETRNFFVDSDDTVYFTLYTLDGNLFYLAFSESPDVTLEIYNESSLITTRRLSSEYNGYYYASVSQGSLSGFGSSSLSVSTSLTSPSDIIDYLFSSSPTLVIGSLVDGCISWLSAVVNGVLQAPLLLFLILSCFIGIAVGLLFRFRRG